MDAAEQVAQYATAHGITEVFICGIDREACQLHGIDGRIYRESRANIWEDKDKRDNDVVYVGTSRHAGGVTLRPLYIRIDGVWRNALTGRDAPDWMSSYRSPLASKNAAS